MTPPAGLAHVVERDRTKYDIRVMPPAIRDAGDME
jgi:hypothetical protein